MNTFGRWRVIAVAIALLFGLVWPTSAPSASAGTLSNAALRSRIVYFQRTTRPTDQALALAEMAKRSAFEATLWNNFLAAWTSANTSQKLNYTPPSDLPGQGHVFVVLGASLSSTGTVTTQLTNRLKVALTALAAYPNSKVLVTGGAPKNGHTEGQVMHDWLIAKGIADDRILTETKASSTVGNATYSMTMLKADATYTSYSLISDASHLRRASVLFDAAAMNLQVKAGQAWPIQRLANVAYKDKTITNPPTASTTSVIASNVASLLGLSSSYSAVVATPPAPAVLTALSVQPTKTTYPIGSAFNRADLVATAIYDQGSLVVTNAVKVTSFDPTTVGADKVWVGYTDGKVTKNTAFEISVVKASAKATVQPSTTTAKKKRTRVSLKVKITSATGVVTTGKVRILVGSKVVKTLTLKASAKGSVSYKLPKFTKTGTKVVKVTYLGSSKVFSTSASVRISVKR
jgi:uncharacterized SAM-binding protein YcdF (DUF218 family)